jgi:hypothetical protein
VIGFHATDFSGCNNVTLKSGDIQGHVIMTLELLDIGVTTDKDSQGWGSGVVFTLHAAIVIPKQASLESVID